MTDSPLEEEEVQTDSPWLSSGRALLRARTRSSLTEVISDSRLTLKRPHGCRSWGNTLGCWGWAWAWEWAWAGPDPTQLVSLTSVMKTSSQAASWEEADSGEQASLSEFHISFSEAEEPSLSSALTAALHVPPVCLPLKNRTLLVLDD